MRIKNLTLLLLVQLFVPLQFACASNQPLDVNKGNAQTHAFAYLDQDVCNSILSLNDLLPEHQWSETFKLLCVDLAQQSNVVLYEQAIDIVNECLSRTYA